MKCIKRTASVFLCTLMIISAITAGAQAKSVKNCVKSISLKKKAVITIPANKKTALREYTVLSKESIAEMTTDYSPGSSLHYGYGLMIPSDGIWMHEGSIDTYLTHELTVPEKKYNLFIATNSTEYQKLSELSQFVKDKTL